MQINLTTTSRAILTATMLASLTLFDVACSRSADPAPAQTGTIVPTKVNGGAEGAHLIRSDYAPGEVTKLCDEAIKDVDAKLKDLVDKSPSWRGTPAAILAFERITADFGDAINGLTFMGYVSTDKDISAEGSDCESKIGEYNVGLYTRRDLYDALKSSLAVTADETRLLSETLKGFEHNGLALPDDKLAEVKALMGELSKKENKFSSNLNADTSSTEFTAEELKGVPADSLARLNKTAQGKYIVTTKSTDYITVAESAVNADVRKRNLLAYLNRGGPENTKLLEEAVALRAQIALKLGYQTWADYRTSVNMVKNKETALNFLNDLKGKLAERNQADFAKLLAFKKELDPRATQVDQWDIAYLSSQLKKRDYSLDDEEVRQYFPADVVVSGMFQVYSQILGVTYKEVTGAKVWADGVKLYEIHDAKTDRLVGYFYTDFYPRELKYGHAAAFPLVSGRVIENGYSLPVSSIVANFTPPSDGKPALLLHDEVETIFHEFGHIMHQTLTRAPYASLSGSAVSRDFVEAPSQMLENWVWSPEVLKILSGHYQDHSRKLPQALLEKMVAARNFGQGLAYTKQLLYALFDMKIHTSGADVDVTKTYDNLYREIVGQEPLEGAHFAGTFGHMMAGYDSGYYGYLWSEVYAQDMFSIFEEDSLLSPVVGAKYRHSILEQGSMKDSIDILKEFLGRDPKPDAFFKKLGI